MKKNYFYFKSAKALEFDKVMEKVAAFAVCPPNKERLINLLPEYDAPCAATLLKQTEAARTLLNYKSGIPIAMLDDAVLQSLGKTEKEISLSAEEIRQIGRLLKTGEGLRQYYFDKKFDTSALDLFFENLYEDKPLLKAIEQTFTPSGAIDDHASPALASIRRQIIRAGHTIKEDLEKYIKSPEISVHLQEPIVTMRSDRYVIPVKADNRGNISGLLHDTSGSGNTLFIEPLFVIEQNNKIKKLELEEQNEILRILAELSAKISACTVALQRSYQTMLALDYTFAKARFSNENYCCTPVVSRQKQVRLTNVRHPLIDRSVMIPISVSMDQDHDTIIVTGPNTGGKTVFLKTIGLSALMIKAGLPVPADSAEIFVFRKIFADIGDEQSIEQSLSTFSSHMRNIKNIIADSNHHDLVLFDELGSGTDPIEGAALAVSIVERIRRKNTFLAATTHYGELKTYALTTSGVINASFSFDLTRICPTYHLQLGIPGKSYAFEISKQLGLPEDVISDAKSRITGEQQNIDQVIDALNEERNAYQERLSKMKEKEKELLEAKAKLENEKKKLNQNADNRLQAAEQKARTIIESARRQADTLQAELKEIRDKMDKAQYHELKSSVKRAGGKLQDIESNHKKEQAKKGQPLSTPPKAGQTVYLPTLNRNVTVESVNGTTAFVVADNLRMRVKVSDLMTPLEEKMQTAVRFQRAEYNRTVKTELDIRGMNVLDATEQIDRFIDQALLAHLPSVTVIHGKGTGVLRAGVHAYLKEHKAVKSFALGTFGQGDSGVTIVNLK